MPDALDLIAEARSWIMRERVAPAPGGMIHDESRAPISIRASENEGQEATRDLAATRSRRAVYWARRADTEAVFMSRMRQPT